LVSPFLDDKVIQLSNELPTDLLVRKENHDTYGKWILRKMFEDKIPKAVAWRKKSPMQDGSGTAGLPHFFDSVMDDTTFSDKIKKIQNEDGIRIRTKESLFYYETFKKYFDKPKDRHEGKLSCPDCGQAIGDDSKFCKMCGAYPV